MPGLSCHDVTDRVLPYDLGCTVISTVAMEDMEGNLYDAEETFQAVFFVFNSS